MQEPGISSKDKHHRHCEIKSVHIIFDNIILHYYVQLTYITWNMYIITTKKNHNQATPANDKEII